MPKSPTPVKKVPAKKTAGKKPAAKAPEQEIDITEDINTSSTISSAELSQITEKAERLIQIEKAMDLLAERAKELSSEYKLIQNVTLPALMEELGLAEFKLNSGDSVSIKPIIAASIPTQKAVDTEKDPDKHIELKLKFETAMAYLEKNGGASLIKTNVTAALPAGSVKLARAAVKALKALKIETEVRKGVHPGALNSWCKEKIENGTELDFDVLGIYSGKQAQVKKKKGGATGV